MAKLVVKKSDMVEKLLRFQGKPLLFKNYPLSRQVIDTKSRAVLLKGGRQISKSVTLASNILAEIMAYSYNSFLYIAPTLPQVKVFSHDKISARVQESPVFKEIYIDKNSIDNVYEKVYTNQSKIYFRAITQLESIRGIAVKKNMFDEVQDIPTDSLPVIMETMSGQEEASEVWYAGTPKSIGNTIETLWQKSKKISPIFICDSGHHTVPSLEHIEPKGLTCPKCKSIIDVRQAYFKSMGKQDAEISGFWIPQIALPLHTENPEKWGDLYRKKLNYPKEKFLNEIMGISAGEGIYLISENDLKMCCVDFRDGSSFDPWPGFINPNSHGISEMWCGIDWGITAVKSYTVLTIGGFDSHTNRFRVVYAKKFLDPDPVRTNIEIAQIIQKFGVQVICADWGAGHYANRDLEERTGIPVTRVFYAGDRLKMYWDDLAGYYKASRTKTLVDTFTQIKKGKFHFYKWEVFKDLAPHFLAEFHEETIDNRGNVVIQFNHPDSEPDDALHSLNFMFSVFKATRDPYGQIFP